MAVVAVIALVIGLRRKVEDASTPTYADWTNEHVGEVVVPPTRTVADAVAERQGNTGRFPVVAPAQPGAVEAGRCDEAAESAGTEKRNGKGLGSRGAATLSSLGPVVSASVVARQTACCAGPGTASVALAEPDEVVAGVEPKPESTAVEGSAADTALRAQAGHPGSDGKGDRPPFPADPLFGAGRFDQVGPDGDPWFTPPAMPRTRLGGSGRPPGPDEACRGEPATGAECPERATDPLAGAAGGAAGVAAPGAAQSEPTTAADSAPAAPHAAGNGSKPASEPPAPARHVTNVPAPEPARHPAVGLPDARPAARPTMSRRPETRRAAAAVPDPPRRPRPPPGGGPARVRPGDPGPPSGGWPARARPGDPHQPPGGWPARARPGDPRPPPGCGRARARAPGASARRSSVGRHAGARLDGPASPAPRGRARVRPDGLDVGPPRVSGQLRTPACPPPAGRRPE